METYQLPVNRPVRQRNFGHPGRLNLVLGCFMAFAFNPVSLFACAACYGQSDSAMAKGMNFGILSLLGVVVSVLGGIAGFFVYLSKRAAVASTAPLTNLPEPDGSLKV
jgi:hypothetical protein